MIEFATTLSLIVSIIRGYNQSLSVEIYESVITLTIIMSKQINSNFFF